MAKNLGPQPARRILRRDARLSITEAAEQINVRRSHLNSALLGYCAPSEDVRERLPRLIGRPLEELFTPESLAEPYRGPNSQSWAYAKDRATSGDAV